MKRQAIGITERGDAALDFEWVPWVEGGRPAILITKDPRKLAARIGALKNRPNIIVHATITGHGDSVLEPNVPSPEKAIHGLESLNSALGAHYRNPRHRIVLRVDPIIPTQKGIETALSVIRSTGPALYSGRIRVSFLDIYWHVRCRFEDAGLEVPFPSTHAPAHVRRAAWMALRGVAPRLEICGEPGFPLECSGCISGIDKAIMIPDDKTISMVGNQRTACECLAEKQELLKNRKRCPHGCLYCYWKD